MTEVSDTEQLRMFDRDLIPENGYIDNECGHEYETVVLRGKVQFINALEEKRLGIETILSHLEANPQPIMQKRLKTNYIFKIINVLKLVISDITGKKGR
jgi:nitroimidazol reductase NimA-like FMN-containing flavoprotein (pyridoxamine 5'-phosphate oxidase superfamily)